MDLCVILYHVSVCVFRLRVYMDDMLEPSNNIRMIVPSMLQIGEVYLGGTPEKSNIANLTGCLRNIFINR